jgi:hypothetical protein
MEKIIYKEEMNLLITEFNKKQLNLIKDRLDSIENELGSYMWYGNEDDIDFKEEYELEYSHLLKERVELNEFRLQIKNK